MIWHDTKQAVKHEAGIRAILKASKRGFPFLRYAPKGAVVDVEYRRGCYCLNRGLMPEKERCPEHGTVIANHAVRHQSMIDD
ncbi:hypothetical protein LCGC14_1682800 [marine sediment metagenome]|uniref:Uncharacterized protein n=1 Tax=marine sediment metagenome TaxID=412755 RepID=A0A0F9K3N0_9ZZZZ